MSNTRPINIKTIGILGGMSNQATAEYYRLINQKVNDQLGGWDIAETVIIGVNFGNIEYFVRNSLWAQMSDYLAQKAEAAERAGADVLVCVSNTVHKVSQQFIRNIDIPFIHIADPTGEAINKAKLSKVALLGTKPVMATPYLRNYYEENYAIDVIVPSEEEQKEIDRIIFDELVRGKIKPASKDYYLSVCHRLQQQGAKGVILGCTEIFLLLSQEDLSELTCSSSDLI